MAKVFVAELFKKKLTKHHYYHNFIHTNEVVEVCSEIAKHYNVNDADFEILLLAGWFHDSGYSFSSYNHEEKSAKIAEEFLILENYNKNKIEKVTKLILSTTDNHKPQNIFEEIIHDADLAHIGRKEFKRKGELLRMEWEYLLDKKFNDFEWANNQLEFLSNKNFYTDYAKKKYKKRLIKNIIEERKIIDMARQNDLKEKAGKNFG
ncbi:MAG: HD domain-containing protein [Ignavibacteriaceae bacterium]